MSSIHLGRATHDKPRWKTFMHSSPRVKPPWIYAAPMSASTTSAKTFVDRFRATLALLFCLSVIPDTSGEGLGVASKSKTVGSDACLGFHLLGIKKSRMIHLYSLR